ncbi:hypothetical protein H4R18_000781 [Coemansia javaensis]|uniref:GH18 domain-containing protein n=1 Tax=Coemansia javaensis TaxID=2761396 RepID=A0A9W8LM99_9FUNG|nr:hypothetical protein H4R18_000781 [Coemansia javaensis]
MEDRKRTYTLYMAYNYILLPMPPPQHTERPCMRSAHPRIQLAAAALLLAAVVAGGPVIVGHYSPSSDVQLAAAELSKYTHLNIVAGAVNPDGSLATDALLAAATTNVKANGPKVLVSIGGGAPGPASLSAVLTDTVARSRLAASLVALVSSSGADGVDVDWRRPGQRLGVCDDGENGNEAGLLKLLTEVRAQFEQQFGIGKKLVTATVGAEALDASAFARVVDYVHLQPFGAAGPGTPPSLDATIDAWAAGGWPVDHLTAGIAFYGRASAAPADAATSQRQVYMGLAVQGDRDDVHSVDPCTGTLAPSGQWQWRNLRTQGVLLTPTKAAAPWVQRRDDTTQTPWLFNPATRTVIGYEDPQSIRAKVAHAAARGLAGASIRSAEMDHNGELLAAVRAWSSTAALGRTQRKRSSCEEDTVTCTDEGNSPDYTVCRNGKLKDGSCRDGKICYQVTDCHKCKDSTGDNNNNSEDDCTNGEGECDDSPGASGFTICKDNKQQTDSCGTGKVCYMRGKRPTCIKQTNCTIHNIGSCVHDSGTAPDYTVCKSGVMVPSSCSGTDVCYSTGGSYRCAPSGGLPADACGEKVSKCDDEATKTTYQKCVNGVMVSRDCGADRLCITTIGGVQCTDKEDCPVDGIGRCLGSGDNGYMYKCISGKQSRAQCDGDNVCLTNGSSYSCEAKGTTKPTKCAEGTSWCASDMSAFNKCTNGAVVTTDCENGHKCETDSNGFSTCK